MCDRARPVHRIRVVWVATCLVAFCLLSALPGVGNGTPASAGDIMIEHLDGTKSFEAMADRSLRLDAQGHPRIAYGGDHLYYAWHDGADWHVATVDESPDVGAYASLALDAEGYAHICYKDAYNGYPKYAYQDADGWHREAVLEGAGCIGPIALDEQGRAHVCYYGSGLKHAHRTADGWHIETVTVDSGGGNEISFYIDEQGYGHVSYHTSVDVESGPDIGYAKYAYQDGTGWHLETVDSGVLDYGRHTSLAVDEQGRAHITFWDYAYGDLKHAWRDASGWQSESVNRGGGAGEELSLALDAQGYAHIAFFDHGCCLKHLWQDSDGWHFEDVATGADVGRWTSLALDGQGYAHISYFNYTSAALEYAYQDADGWHVEVVDTEGEGPPSTPTPTAVPSATPTSAPVTHQVPGDYATIAEALAAAGWGDTVQVAPGTYQEGPLHIPSGVSLVGAAWETTIIDGNGASVVIYTGPGSLVEGFTIRGSGSSYWDAGVWVGSGLVTVRNNRITGNSQGIVAYCWDPATCAVEFNLESNVVDGNSSNGINSNEGPVLYVRNNTVVNNEDAGVVLNNSGSLAENNIVVGNGHGLVNPFGATVRYNDVWGNEWGDYSPGDPGEGGLSMDPMFRDLTNGDYRLRAGSPAVGHGTPSGTDMGALPFTPGGTPPVGAGLVQTGDLEWTATWYPTDAEGYNLYLGTLPGLYGRRFDVGDVTSYPLGGLPSNLSYYVAVSGYDANGDESRTSSEASFFVPSVGNGMYQEDSPAVILTGDWTRLTDGQASGGAYAVSQTEGDTVEFTFSGDSFVLYRTMGDDGFRAAVSIDETSYGNLQFGFFERRWQVPAIFDGLGSGVHRLRLRVSSYWWNVWIDAFGVPSPYAASEAQQQALERVNYHRIIAGIPPARGVQAIHEAAQSHAEFYANNRSDPRLAGLGFHEEYADLPGYTGAGPSDRAAHFGYSGGVGEDGHFVGDPVGSVDGWMATVYHRNLIMCYGCTDLGYGMVRYPLACDALNMGSQTYTAPSSRLIYTYPASGQTGLYGRWNGGEIPDPLPDIPRPVGYPVSLHIVQGSGAGAQIKRPAQQSWLAPQAAYSAAWEVTTAELRDASGQLVPIYFLDQYTDPNSYLGPDNVFLIPHSPMPWGNTYTAHVAGTDSRGVAFDHTWSFTIGDSPMPTATPTPTHTPAPTPTPTPTASPPAGTAIIALRPGWNLVSLPVDLGDTSLAAVLAPIAGHYDLVYAYDAWDTADPWKKHNTAAPPFLNDLTDIDRTMGIWIRASAPANLAVSCAASTSLNIPLKTGWNLVGYASAVPRPIDEALANIDGKYDLVYAHDASDAADPWKKYNTAAPPFLNDLTEMGPGWGYWIRVSEDCTWTVP